MAAIGLVRSSADALQDKNTLVIMHKSKKRNVVRDMMPSIIFLITRKFQKYIRADEASIVCYTEAVWRT